MAQGLAGPIDPPTFAHLAAKALLARTTPRSAAGSAAGDLGGARVSSWDHCHLAAGADDFGRLTGQLGLGLVGHEKSPAGTLQALRGGHSRISSPSRATPPPISLANRQLGRQALLHH